MNLEFSDLSSDQYLGRRSHWTLSSKKGLAGSVLQPLLSTVLEHDQGAHDPAEFGSGGELMQEEELTAEYSSSMPSQSRFGSDDNDLPSQLSLGGKPLICPACEANCRTVSSFIMHMNWHRHNGDYMKMTLENPALTVPQPVPTLPSPSRTTGPNPTSPASPTKFVEHAPCAKATVASKGALLMQKTGSPNPVKVRQSSTTFKVSPKTFSPLYTASRYTFKPREISNTPSKSFILEKLNRALTSRAKTRLPSPSPHEESDEVPDYPNMEPPSSESQNGIESSEIDLDDQHGQSQGDVAEGEGGGEESEEEGAGERGEAGEEREGEGGEAGEGGEGEEGREEGGEEFEEGGLEGRDSSEEDDGENQRDDNECDESSEESNDEESDSSASGDLEETPSPAQKRRLSGLNQCETCGRIFKTLQNLKGHRAAEHDGENPFKCSICKLDFRWKRSLEIHMGKHREDGRRFECKTCHEHFSTKQHMVRHQLLHTGVKNFECQVCNTKFFRKDQLWAHYNEHIANDPGECSNCGAQFESAEDHYDHLKEHNCS